jgi:MFS family permease
VKVVGVIFSAHPIAEILFCPLGSALCRKLGRSTVFRFGLLLLSIGTCAFGLAPSVGYFILSRLISGVGSTFVQVAGLAQLMQHSEKHLARNLGILEMMAGIGYAIGPLLGGILYSHIGLEMTYMYFSLVPLAIMFLHIQTVLVLPRPSDKERLEELDEAFQLRELLNLGVFSSCLAISITAASYGFLDISLSAQ